MVSWATVNTLLFPLGLFLFRNGLGYYRSLRSTYQGRKPNIHPAPPGISRALNILFLLAFAALISTFPYFSPSNVFAETDGRFQTPTDVIFNRISALRSLTQLDHSLRAKLASKDARLYYFTYGPNVVADCPFCRPDDPLSYFYYALPSILAPHILHIAVLGFVTSSILSGREGTRWRIHATVVGVALAAANLYLVATYDIKKNTRSTQTSNIDFFFWRMRLIRGLTFAAVDGLLGWMMWLAATNRFFVTPPTVTQRLEALGTVVAASNYHLWAAGNVRNTVVRDRESRERVARYWNEEKGLYEEREVVDAIKDALARIDMQQLADVADQRAADVVRALQPARPAG